MRVHGNLVQAQDDGTERTEEEGERQVVQDIPYLLLRGKEEKRVHCVVLVATVTVGEGGTAAGRWGQNVPETGTRKSHVLKQTVVQRVCRVSRLTVRARAARA